MAAVKEEEAGTSETEEKIKMKTSTKGSIGFLVVAVAAAAGLAYYLWIYVPKQKWQVEDHFSINLGTEVMNVKVIAVQWDDIKRDWRYTIMTVRDGVVLDYLYTQSELLKIYNPWLIS